MIKGEYVNIGLNRLSNGDKDNGSVYSRFEKDEKLAQFQLDCFLECWQSDVIPMIESIFSGNIDRDTFDGCTTILTFWDELLERTGGRSEFDAPANELFFALLVNYCASRLPGVHPIKSYGAVQVAKQEAGDKGHMLDYRQYIINREGEGDFEDEYIKAKIMPPGYNSEFEVEVPIKHIGPKKLGIVKMCTENIPSKLQFEKDSDNEGYEIPAYQWTNMMREKMGKRSTVRFAKTEQKAVSEMFNTDESCIREVLDVNDIRKVFEVDLENSATATDFDDITGNLIIDNVRKLPDLSYNGKEVTSMAWWQLGNRKYSLHSPKFYVANRKSGEVSVYSKR